MEFISKIQWRFYIKKSTNLIQSINREKNMNNSIDAEKPVDIIQ